MATRQLGRHDQQASVAGLSACAPGLFWMLLARLMFVLLDTIAKYLTETYPMTQVTWTRFTINAILVVLILNRRVPALLIEPLPRTPTDPLIA